MLNNENYALIIPARYESSRFPGKPLADIAGTSLIQRVWIQCAKAIATEKVVIATDDQRIAHHCLGFGAEVEMTSTKCLTGTDRVREVVLNRQLDFALNVQGDEPLIRPEDIQAVLSAFTLCGGSAVVNAMAPIYDDAEWKSLSVPKVVFDHEDRLLYMSRAPIPANKDMQFISAWKQVCIYAFSADHLNYDNFKQEKALFEKHEDIEVLRFVENGVPVKMIRVPAGTIAVDFPEDVEKVRIALARK